MYSFILQQELNGESHIKVVKGALNLHNMRINLRLGYEGTEGLS